MNQAIVDDDYVHVFVDSVEMESVIFEVVLPAPYCNDDECSNVEFEVRVTWET